MSRFIPDSRTNREDMLRVIGAESFQDLLKPVPEKYRMSRPLDLPGPLSEMELVRAFRELAGRNLGAGMVCFAGGGAYDHFIPAALDHILLRSEFYTAYTPYQAEVSQGTLQAIFEYQTMIARLTGMEMANASMYDGGSAAAEACMMAMRVTGRNKVLVAGSLNPRWLGVIRTYIRRKDLQLDEVPFGSDGTLDLKVVEDLAGDDTAAVLVQYPNYFGLVEDLEPLAETVHRHKGLLIAAADPVALPLLRSPGGAGADIVVGEGQSMGIPLSYGGPYVGFMASTVKLARKMPGRIIGRT
ncbi:MAG: aminomethyl-transferring glycine dehydrogenase subunit GcvPA, partial [Candidatus Fermentibacteraceae bacterium]|nr:aminomethyl-transferring glycine dehydrogenase subunit GcvPA [Candidatus Fermentibacteraceae bacterium]